MIHFLVADCAFRIAIAKPNVLFVVTSGSLQRSVSKLVALDTVRSNVQFPALREMRRDFAHIARYLSDEAISIVSNNVVSSNMMPTYIGFSSLAYAQDTELLRNYLFDPHVGVRS